MTLRQRQPREECPAFLAFVRTQPCCVCRARAPSQAAHIRMGNLEFGKRPTGIGEKPSDRWAAPLCEPCHLTDPDSQHNTSEAAFWTRVRLDPFTIAAELYAAFAKLPQPKVRAPRQRKPRPKPKRPKQKIPARKDAWPKRKFRR